MMGRLHGEQSLSMLVGAPAIIQGLGEPTWGGPFYPLHHTTDPEAKIEEITEPESFSLGKAKKVPECSFWPLKSTSSSLSRDYLHFLLHKTNKRKQSIYCSLISDHKTNTCSLVIWKIRKGTKKKIKITRHFTTQRQTAIYFLQNVIVLNMLFCNVLSSPNNIL